MLTRCEVSLVKDGFLEQVKQQELERQGVKLEKTIRELCEKTDRERADAGNGGKDANENNGRESLGPEVGSLTCIITRGK